DRLFYLIGRPVESDVSDALPVRPPDLASETAIRTSSDNFMGLLPTRSHYPKFSGHPRGIHFFPEDNPGIGGRNISRGRVVTQHASGAAQNGNGPGAQVPKFEPTGEQFGPVREPSHRGPDSGGQCRWRGNCVSFSGFNQLDMRSSP